MDECPDDFHKLALGLAERIDFRLGINVRSKKSEVSLGPLRHFAPVQESDRPRCGIAPERRIIDQDVLRNCESRQKRKFLVDDDNTPIECSLRIRGFEERAIQFEIAAIRLQIPAQDLDQGALAGAILAKNGMNFALAHGKGDVLQRLGCPETPGYALCDKTLARSHPNQV